MAHALLEQHEPVQDAEAPAEVARPTYRLLATMKQGTAASLPGTWERFATLADARSAGKAMTRDDRVLRVMIVIDAAPPRFCEWL